MSTKSKAAFVGGAALAVVVGLVCVEPLLSHAKTGAHIATVKQPIADQPIAAATLAIAPSSVIDTDAQLFYGSGDGGNGLYR